MRLCTELINYFDLPPLPRRESEQCSSLVRGRGLGRGKWIKLRWDNVLAPYEKMERMQKGIFGIIYEPIDLATNLKGKSLSNGLFLILYV